MTKLFLSRSFGENAADDEQRDVGLTNASARLPSHGRSPEPQLPSPRALSIGVDIWYTVLLRDSQSRTGDLHPTNSRPCRAYQERCSRRATRMIIRPLRKMECLSMIQAVTARLARG